MKIRTVLSIFFATALFYTSPVFAEYFQQPPSSPILMHLAGTLTIDGEAAKIGDEVGIFDESGNVVGVFVVEKEGMFGDMVISGDYDVTGEVEGSIEAESLEVKVWQASTETEYSGTMISLNLPEEGEAIYSPYPELSLKFEGGTFYLLNLEVGY